MNPLKALILLACLVAAISATPSGRSGKKQQNLNNVSLKPTDWLTPTELQSIPPVDELNLQRLENMPVDDAAQLIERLYHLATINHHLQPSFVPSATNIPAYIIKHNGQNVSTNLANLVQTAKQQSNLGNQEVTLFITGLPSDQSKTVAKANNKLVRAYVERYNAEQQRKQQEQQRDNSQENQMHGKRTSSEENEDDMWKANEQTDGNLIVIDLGVAINKFPRYALLNIEQTGRMIGSLIVELTNSANVVHESIHIVAQGVAAHVAGAAGRQYTRMTGHQLRRITALDPSKIFSKRPNTISGLARGDAEFVDAIHTSAYGMGTSARVGDVDFYPNGPSVAVPGANNILEASMRATRFYAESVRPGNERNFPAVAANSLQQYLSNNGQGKRVYMGIATPYNAKGDYMLQVNPVSPFGQRTAAKKQNNYHATHQPTNRNAKTNNDADYE